MGLKVAAVQLGIYRSQAKAVSEAERQVREASSRSARLVCLPEHWLRSRVLKEDDEILARFRSLARELGIYLNLGGSFERRGPRTFMTSQTISPEGKIISRQDKIHLYRRENRTASPGSRLNVMDIDGHKVAVLVCHDVVFPETAREAVFKGAELLLVPSLIPSKGIEPWLVYLRARALENRVPVMAPNIFLPPQLPGRSTVVGLKYDRRAHVMELSERTAPDRRYCLTADLDLAPMRPYREERLRELRLAQTFKAR